MTRARPLDSAPPADTVPGQALQYPDALIHEILSSVDTIAMVGASKTWRRPSYYAMSYLQNKGYRVIPINPSCAGEEILGERVHASLDECPGPIDMVDVFRAAEAVPAIAREAVANRERLGIRVFWMQLGVISPEAAEIAESAGFTVIMDRCPKIEFGRLSGELSWGGVNSGVLTAKRLKPIRK